MTIETKETDIRHQVTHFSRLMEEKLRVNDHKGGWDDCHPFWLLAKLTEEIGELGESITKMYPSDGSNGDLGDSWNQGLLVATIDEAVDVGNVAMMMVDVLTANMKEVNYDNDN
jgi:NTP pyrophosphatase (non-canonical NTP hydrolase)